MTVGSVWSVNRGWCMAAGGAGIYSFMWLPALCSSAMLRVELLCSLLSYLVLLKCIWFNSVVLCSVLSRKYGSAFCSLHPLSDSFFLDGARCAILWSVQLTSALISAVIYFAPRVGVMNHTQNNTWLPVNDHHEADKQLVNTQTLLQIILTALLLNVINISVSDGKTLEIYRRENLWRRLLPLTQQNTTMQ